MPSLSYSVARGVREGVEGVVEAVGVEQAGCSEKTRASLGFQRTRHPWAVAPSSRACSMCTELVAQPADIPLTRCAAGSRLGHVWRASSHEVRRRNFEQMVPVERTRSEREPIVILRQ